MSKVYHCVFIASLLIYLTPAIASEATVNFRGKTYSLNIDTCRSGDSWHMIDATGDDASLSIVGNTNQDGSTYETLDFITGDVRLSDVNKDKPFQFKNGAYQYSGEIHQSDSSSPGQIEVMVSC